MKNEELRIWNLKFANCHKMHYYSTNKKVSPTTLQEAVVRGLAPDRGLYMPEKIEQPPRSFFNKIGGFELTEVAKAAAGIFFGEDIKKKTLDKIKEKTKNIEITLMKIE